MRKKSKFCRTFNKSLARISAWEAEPHGEVDLIRSSSCRRHEGVSRAVDNERNPFTLRLVPSGAALEDFLKETVFSLTNIVREPKLDTLGKNADTNCVKMSSVAAILHGSMVCGFMCGGMQLNMTDCAGVDG